MHNTILFITSAGCQVSDLDGRITDSFTTEVEARGQYAALLSDRQLEEEPAE